MAATAIRPPGSRLSRRARAVLAQTVLLAAVFALAAWLIGNVAGNFAALDKGFGFSFLWRLPANYDINQSLISYSSADSHLRAALVGLLNTLAVAAAGIVVATLLGFAVGALRLSRNWLASRLAAVYVEVTRNIPVLLFVLLWHAILIAGLPPPRAAIDLGGIAFLSNRGAHLPRLVGGPDLWAFLLATAAAALAATALLRLRRDRVPGRTLAALVAATAGFVAILALSGPLPSVELPRLQGFNFAGGTTLIPEFVALAWALAFYTSGFIAETVRAGILSVDRGQSEAARALGLRERQVLRLVVLPQALRAIVPPLTSEYLNLTKNSSLAIAIGYMDLVATLGGITLNQTGREMEAMILVMGVYLAISAAIAFFMNRYNARIGRVYG
jgi:general L-amino acid transport system permease protein